MNPEVKKQKRLKLILGITFFALVFFFLCIVKIWFAVLLSFAFGIILTLFQKKTGFCYHLCPLGNLQDIAFENKTGRKKRIPRHKPLYKAIFFILFFGYILFYIIAYYPDDLTLWQAIFRLVAFSAILSLVLQEILIKRFFCVFLCPIGTLMDKILNWLRKK